MTVRPVLGVSCCVRPVSGEPAYNVMTRYARAAGLHADAAVLLVPAMGDLMSAREAADRLDGLLLTGSPSNLASRRYGPDDPHAPGPFDEARDEMSLALIDAMIELGRPVFGICRGFQEMNVALGGTLRRDLSGHHAPDGVSLEEMFAFEHGLDLTPGGVLAEAIGDDLRPVNSVHYQGIDRLAAGLRVEAVAPDGLVEAFSAIVNGARLLGVQWHPEWRTQARPDYRAFFTLLAAALRGG